MREFWATLWCGKVMIGYIALSVILSVLAIIGLMTVLVLAAGGSVQTLSWHPPICKHHECPIQKPPGGEV